MREQTFYLDLLFCLKDGRVTAVKLVLTRDIRYEDGLASLVRTSIRSGNHAVSTARAVSAC